MGTGPPDPGFAIWLTGLPSSGKTTLAEKLREVFSNRGIHTQVLDSDELRTWLTPDPAYSQEERDWFYRAMVHIAALLTDNGVPLVIAATAPRRAYRQAARDLIRRCAVVYLRCTVIVCQDRDTKGLWERAIKGEIENLPGVGAPYEIPLEPEVIVDTKLLSPDQAAMHILQVLDTIGFLNEPDKDAAGNQL